MKKLVLLMAVCAVPLFADQPQTALLATPTTTARTATAITTQNDDLRMEATVKWLGPSSVGSLIVYNGNGCCSGWGILVFSSNDTPANAIAVLAGGVTIVPSNLTLTPNVWQHVSMDRVNQDVTLTLSSADNNDHTPPQTVDLGVVPANFVGFLRPAQTLVGDAFNGFISDAAITSLAGTPSVIESWDFSQAPATFNKLVNLYGPTATGSNGHVLNLTSSWAVPARGNN
ncbi:MAG TPA: hypothetical protein VKU62_14100 [Thermoanaerobaculia bacterium]|nr:hypothetical protein [Thermoanaerobaculia bacterium]